MGNTIQTFTNDAFGVIRTITNDGQTLFCGKDVATVLGYTNTKDALTRHCKGFVNHYPLQTICVCGGGAEVMRLRLVLPHGRVPVRRR